MNTKKLKEKTTKAVVFDKHQSEYIERLANENKRSFSKQVRIMLFPGEQK